MVDSRQSERHLSGGIGRRPWPAWSLSFVMHLGLLLLAAYVLRFAPRGTPSDDPDRTVGVALVRESMGEPQYVTAADAEQEAASSESPLSDALPPETEMSADLAGILPADDGGLAASSSFTLPSTGGARTAGNGREGLADHVRTTIFGTSGSGSKFVYVFDRSGSMAGFGGRPLAAAKRELIHSLDDLNDTTQFQIIFYNENPHVFHFRKQAPTLVWADPQARAAAGQFVEGITATGSTRHLAALKMALGLSPDVVFFLTDADEPQLTSEELRRVQRWNQSTAINAIEFGFGPRRQKRNFLARLAQENGGQHVYVDVSGLIHP